MDYRGLVSREAPEGLLFRYIDDLKDGLLVYEQVKMPVYKDGGIWTGETARMVKVTCSECEMTDFANYAKGEGYTYSGKKSTYGFVDDWNFGEAVYDGDEITCPNCGASLTVRKAASIGSRLVCTDETFCLSASLLPGARGERPLVLTRWWLRLWSDRDGRSSCTKDAIEAYIFEPKQAVKLNGYRIEYNPHKGGFRVVSPEWRQPKDWSDTSGQYRDVYGLTAEMVEESCLANSKFYEYMKGWSYSGWKSPVAYLRAYQKWPQIENLVVQGAGYLLDRMLDAVWRSPDWEGRNDKGLPVLPDLDLTQNRPAQMLRLNKEEFRWCREMKWDLYHLNVYVKAKEIGRPMELPGDVTLLHEYGAEDIEKILPWAPVGKTIRYLFRQMEAFGLEPEDEDPDPDAGLIGATLLADYWRMAERLEWDLNDPAVMWPKDLLAAHDGAAGAVRVESSKLLWKDFKARKKKLMRYAYTSGGLTITPAGSQEALNYESKVLGHCVKTYGEDCAKGLTAIFFIRHTWAPGRPYYTLELDEKGVRVKQNRGRHNCPRTKEVKKFEDEWLAWVKKGCPRKADGTPVGAKPPVRKKPKEDKPIQKKGANVA